MRIEKISDNQIRCFLSREEMENRQIRLCELAYGTEKARALFHELLQEASARCGFSAQDTPIMIEAVPLQDDSLVLTVTKVDNPEELDTRFSSFAPFVRSGEAADETASASPLGQLLDAIRREFGENTDKEDAGGRSGRKSTGRIPVSSSPEIMDRSGQGTPPGASSDGGTSSGAGVKTVDDLPAKGLQLFTFSTIADAADAAAAAAPGFTGSSSLYRDPEDRRYYLFITPAPGTAALSYSGTLSVFSEFGKSEYITPAREQHLREHCEVLCRDKAVQMLAGLS